MVEWKVPTVGFQRYVERVPLNRPNLLLPGLRSDDPRMLSFLRELAAALEDKFPASDTEGGLLKAPFSPGGWLKLHNLSGYKMNPLGIPRVGKRPKREGFASKLHEQIFDRVVERYLGVWGPQAARINKMSSTGLPHFSYDPALKINYAQAFEKQQRRIKERAAKSQWIELFEEVGIAMMSAETRRSQSTDSVKEDGDRLTPKARPVMTFEGEEVIADKRTPWPDFFAQRIRLAIAFSSSYGIFMQMIISGYRDAALELPIWHHTTPLQISTKLSRHPHILAGDVSNFDQNMDPALVRRMFQRLSKDWDDSVVNMFQACINCPLVVNEDRVGGPGRFRWLNNPQSNDFGDLWYGFPSGIPPVSDAGKMYGAFIDIVPLFDLGFCTELEEVDQILMGTHPLVTVLNAGDDFVIGLDSEDMRRALEEYFNSNSHPYFDVAVESPASFLGNVISLDQGEVITYPNIVSYNLGMFGRERGIDSRFSPHWAFGYRQKKLHFAAHPLFPEVDALTQSIAKARLGATLDQIIPMEEAPAGSNVRSFFDFLFVTNSDSIHYKIRPRDVSPDLLAEVFITIPASDVERITQGWRRR